MSGKKSAGRIRRRANSSSSSQSDPETDQEFNPASKQGKGVVNTQRSNPSQSQSSAPKTMRAELNEDDKKRLVADAVFYVLVQEQKRAVHKKGEILKVCIQNTRARIQNRWSTNYWDYTSSPC